MATATPELSSAPPSLWSDRGCPFAHRVLALCKHLGWPLERHECEVGELPDGIERYSSSGRLPLMVHGDVVLGESRVMLEHLAEHGGFAEALPRDLPARTLHRYAMALADAFVVPRMTRTTPETAPARLDEVLDVLDRATSTTPSVPCLLAFHIAPLWLRVCWWNAEGSVSRGVVARPALHAWLERAAALDAIRRTAPKREAHVRDLHRAQQLGLVPWEQDDVAGDESICTPRDPSRQGADNYQPRSQS
jgi:glutathione S-transferase